MAGLNLTKVIPTAKQTMESPSPAKSSIMEVTQSPVESTEPTEFIAEPKARPPEPVEQPGESDETPKQPENEFVFYSCAPVERFKIGSKYRFENKQLRLPKDEEEEFDAMLAKMDPRTRQIVKKIDSKRADAFVRNMRKQATKQIDSGSMPENQSRTFVGKRPIEEGSDI